MLFLGYKVTNYFSISRGVQLQKLEKNYLCIVKLYFFNYSHDAALACAPIFYNPSGVVASLEYDLMSLATFCAGREDTVAVNPRVLDICRAFYSRLPIPEVQFEPTDRLPGLFVEPWGWDVSLLMRLQKGMKDVTPPSEFPSPAQLETFHHLSSRRSAVTCLHLLRESLPKEPLCGESYYCTTESEIRTALNKCNGDAVLKAPFSGSGRGLRLVRWGCSARLENWCRNLLEHQGGVEVEPLYNKIFDLAVEFSLSPDGAVYQGLSLFRTSEHGAYVGGLVASQSLLMRKIESEGMAEAYEQTMEALQSILPRLFPLPFLSCLGVDMMLCRQHQTGEIMLHPCVEINVRRTMGHLALSLASLVAPGKEAVFNIHYEVRASDLRDFATALSKPVLNESGKLYKGALLLAPVTEETHYLAWLEIR